MMNQDLIFVGNLRHRRYFPKYHEFNYKLYYLYFNPAHIQKICKTVGFLGHNRFNFLSFFRKHYIGQPQESIQHSIEKLLYPDSQKNNSSIYMMAQLAHLGYCFNPISLYFSLDSENLQSIIADVHNTPWGEKHAYVLTQPTKHTHPYYEYVFQKKLHVSPFMQMDYLYDFHLKFAQHDFVLHMQNKKNEKVAFDVTLKLEGYELNAKNLKHTLLKHPFMTQKIIFAIYWQAFKLFCKKVPIISHP